MIFTFEHFNFNVMNIENSKKFYAEALGLEETHRIQGDDYLIVYLGDGVSGFELELTELSNHPEKYDLGEGEFHLALSVEEFEEAFKRHQAMGCVCFVNEEMGIYFIIDPDGYWIEIIPRR